MNYTCADCAIHACQVKGAENHPKNCPIKVSDIPEEVFPEYLEPATYEFYVECSKLEADGYGSWTRVQEIMEFAGRMNYRRLGVAFCNGLRNEAKIFVQILRRHGFDVVSVICKVGGIPKENVGISREHQVAHIPYDVMCNPIAQAKLLNDQKTDFNIVIGLCVGHDSLFYKHSDAPVTTLITKDRVLCNNPAGALYCSESYYKNKL